MRLTVEKIVYPGRSLGFEGGKAVFTDRGLPGESVEVEVVRERQSFNEARTIRILEPGEGRVEPRCEHFLACSPYQEMAYPLQLDVKRGQVEEILARGLKIKLGEIPIVPSPEIWGYRNRFRLRLIWEDGGKPRAAYHEPGERASFVPVDGCHLVPDEANAVAAELVRTAGAEEWRTMTGVEVRTSRATGKSLAVVHLEKGEDVARMAGPLAGLQERLALAGVVALTAEGRKVRERVIAGKPYLEERAGGTTYRIGAESFFQVNRSILESVFESVRREVAPFREGRVADMYCGVGTFGIHLAGEVGEVFGVEPEPANIAYLKKNLALNRTGNFTVCEGTAEEWLPWIMDKDVGAIILDPPRRGVSPGLLGALAQDPVPLVLYLSCNPATLARDLGILLPAYEIVGLGIYDFFPHTPHIETLTILRRGSNLHFCQT